MKKIIVDIAYDTLNDFHITLAKIVNSGLTYRILNINGPGAGWPEVEVSGDESQLRPMVDWLTGDTQYYDDFIEEGTHTN